MAEPAVFDLPFTTHLVSVFLLVLARTLAWVTVVPLFAPKGIPPVARIGLAVALALFLTPLGVPRSQAIAGRTAQHWLMGSPLHWMNDWSTPFALHVASASGTRVIDVDGNLTNGVSPITPEAPPTSSTYTGWPRSG